MTKHDNTPGFGAMIEFLYVSVKAYCYLLSNYHYRSGDHLRASACISETLMDPATSHSTEMNDTAIQKAFAMRVPFIEWLDQPDQLYRCKRFGAAARGLGSKSGLWSPVLLTGS